MHYCTEAADGDQTGLAEVFCRGGAIDAGPLRPRRCGGSPPESHSQFVFQGITRDC